MNMMQKANTSHPPTPRFNSLGSHYDATTIRAAISGAFALVQQQLQEHLGITKQSQPALIELREWMREYINPAADGVFSFYKGRDAIEYALRMHAIGASGTDAVITQAFSCHAVPAAIERAGARPVFCDIDATTHNPSTATIREALDRAEAAGLRPRAVMIQHTLGLPAPMEDIRALCDERGLLLIEDVAQALGATYPDATDDAVGTLGDCCVFSFGRDKILDGVSGGGLVVRELPRDIPLPHIGRPPISSAIRDMLYPLLTAMIRHTYDLQLGKILHRFFHSIGLLGSPIASPTDEVTHLPASHATVINTQRRRLSALRAHRTARHVEYDEALSEQYAMHDAVTPLGTPAQRAAGSHLRYSLEVPDPAAVLEALAAAGYHVTDRWYRAAVDSGSLAYASTYTSGTCPEAERLATHVINVPTHMGISQAHIHDITRQIAGAIDATEAV